MIHSLACAAICLASLGLHGSVCQAQTVVVLRDATVLSPVQIERFDETALWLSNERKLAWWQVLQVRGLNLNDQVRVDSIVRDIGLPMFRLRTRLLNRDWPGASEIAERRSLGSPSKNEALDFLVALASMHGKIHAGDRAAAVVRFLTAARIQKGLNAFDQSSLNGLLLSNEDIRLQVSSEILPLWFNLEQVDTALPELASWVEKNNGGFGAELYLASMQIAVGRESDSLQKVRRFQSPGVEDWRSVVEVPTYLSQKQYGRAKLLIDRMEGADADSIRAIAAYFDALYSVEQVDRADLQVLGFLRLPALWGERFPSLSASALFRASEILSGKNRSKESGILRNELLRRYPNTYHGQLIKSQKD